MTIDWVGPAMTQSVPWVATVGITFGETTASRCVAYLPDVATSPRPANSAASCNAIFPCPPAITTCTAANVRLSTWSGESWSAA